MKFVHYKREVDSLVKAKEDEHITSLILNDIVEQVVLIQVAEKKSNATLQKVKDELSRSMDERSAMAIKLQDLMVKISSLAGDLPTGFVQIGRWRGCRRLL